MNICIYIYISSLTELVADMRTMDMFAADTHHTPPSAYISRRCPTSNVPQVIAFVHMDDLFAKTHNRDHSKPWDRLGVYRNWTRDKAPGGSLP